VDAIDTSGTPDRTLAAAQAAALLLAGLSLCVSAHGAGAMPKLIDHCGEEYGNRGAP
jgi:hypothetical protein